MSHSWTQKSTKLVAHAMTLKVKRYRRNITQNSIRIVSIQNRKNGGSFMDKQ